MRATRRVMLFVESSRAYGRGCLLGIAGYMRAHGPWQVLHSERGSGADELPPLVKNWGGEGIIVRMENERLAEAVGELGLPTVDLRALYRPKGVALMDTDSKACSHMAIEHFLSRGFAHLAYCGFPGVDFSDHRERFFVEMLSDRDIPSHVFASPASPRHVRSTFERETGGEMDVPDIAQWLARLPKPIGIFACNDSRGRQVLTACDAAGLAVPDEVAVLGVDNDQVLCELSDPPLSTIEPDTYRLGYDAASILESMMQGGRAPEQIVLIPPRRIVVRASSDVLAVDDSEVAQALRFIRDHACAGITVEDVLNQSPVSRSTMERRFTEHIGRSPKQEIDRIRIQRARQLLAETDYSLARIAQMTGYASAAHLVTAFKQRTGQTPGQFRQEAAGFIPQRAVH